VKQLSEERAPSAEEEMPCSHKSSFSALKKLVGVPFLRKKILSNGVDW